MAAIIGRVAALFGAQTLEGTLFRTALAGLGSVAVTDLISAIKADTGSGNAQAIASAKRVPQYAVVDLHTDKIVKTLSARKVYILLTHRGKSKKSTRLVVLREGEKVTRR